MLTGFCSQSGSSGAQIQHKVIFWKTGAVPSIGGLKGSSLLVIHAGPKDTGMAVATADSSNRCSLF